MKRLLLVGLVIVGLLMAGCGQKPKEPAASAPAAPAAPQKVIEIKMTGHMPIGQYCTDASLMFQKEVEEKTKGAIKFTYFPAGQLAMDNKAYDLCKSGGVQMAEFFTSRASGIIPEVMLSEIPCFENPDQYTRKVFDKTSGGALFPEFFKSAFEKQGFYIMPGFMHSPEHGTITKKPVRTMADYNGLKVRVSGRAFGSAAKSWGAVPVIMTSSEVYTALQRGTIDGSNSATTTFVSRKWYEVANHAQLLNETSTMLYVLVNLDFWKTLSPEHQKIIKAALKKATIYSYEEGIKEYEENVKFLKSKGVEVFDFPTQAPQELEKIVKATYAAAELDVKPQIKNEETWKRYLTIRDESKKGTLTWKQVIEGMEY